MTKERGLISAKSGHNVSIDEVDDDEACRWWQALFAKGQGRKAEIASDDHGAFFAPWAVEVQKEFTVVANRNHRKNASHKRNASPASSPSAVRAMEYLRKFCDSWNMTTDEFAAAMSVALMLPIHVSAVRHQLAYNGG